MQVQAEQAQSRSDQIKADLTEKLQNSQLTIRKLNGEIAIKA